MHICIICATEGQLPGGGTRHNTKYYIITVPEQKNKYIITVPVKILRCAHLCPEMHIITIAI